MGSPQSVAMFMLLFCAGEIQEMNGDLCSLQKEAISCTDCGVVHSWMIKWESDVVECPVCDTDTVCAWISFRKTSRFQWSTPTAGRIIHSLEIIVTSCLTAEDV
jgi:hypothetical protein